MLKIAVSAAAVLIFLVLLFSKAGRPIPEPPTLTETPPAELTETEEVLKEAKIIAENLNIPWEIAYLPDGRMLVTERPGSLVLINGSEQSRIQVNGVTHRGEGGLLGLALDPDFSTNQHFFLYYTTTSGNRLINRVDRFTFRNNSLSEKVNIVDNIPAGSNHNGGRLKFGPDDLLYITTGDSGNSDLAQNTNSLAGKILRVAKDGSIPEDNPFGDAVYSYGHRNPQGLVWDSSGQLWSVEHGPSGSETGYDELNIIVKGGNYGWPKIKGNTTAEGLITSVINSGGNETWAPSGLEYINGYLYFGGLRGETLYSFKDGELERNLTGDYGRIRIVSLSPNGNLIIGTSNRDGRGKVREGDDKLIEIPVSILKQN